MNAELIGLTGAVFGALLATITQILLSRRQWREQLRVAALEKRLATHQEAYVLCHKLRCNVWNRTQERGELQRQFGDWWVQNCLYLGPRSRQALDLFSYQFAMLNPEDPSTSMDKVKVFLEKFYRPALAALTEEVALPPLNEHETDQISNGR